ncbi:MAG: uracil-DNA glycosylase family protein, partial [Gemmatimonadaceae bacterium]
FLDREIAALPTVRVIVALGRIGFDAYLSHLKRAGVIASKAPYAFGHGVEYRTPDERMLVGSYHPSNQNTNTGKLTEEMFTELFERVAARMRNC